MMVRYLSPTGGLATRASLLLLVLVAVTGCSAVATAPRTPDLAEGGLDYHRQRYEAASAAQDFRACRDEGLRMDTLARQSGNPGQYLTSARVLAGCEERLASGDATVDEAERMRVLALSVQNHAKGGDVAAARAALDDLRHRFEGRDLYYPDGTSVIETLEMVLGLTDPAAAAPFSVANVNATLKAELRRARYWQQH